MNLLRLAIYRPIATLMLALALVFLGVVSLRELPVQRMPDVVFPSMTCYAMVEGRDLSPEEMNDFATRPIERMVASLPGILEMRSWTSPEGCSIYAQFTRNTDVRFRVVDLQDRLAKWASQQTQKIQWGVSPMAASDNEQALMQIALTFPSGQEFRTASIVDSIRRKLKSINGVARVDTAGEMSANLTLETDGDELATNGLSVYQLRKAINDRAQDKVWLGAFKEAAKSRNVFLSAKTDTLTELLRLPVDEAGAFPVGAIAKPQFKTDRSKQIYRLNGREAAYISIRKEKDRNAIGVARAVRARLKEIESGLPAGFELAVLRDEARELEGMIAKLVKLAAVGAALATLVLLVFQRSWRLSLVVAFAIPSSVIIAFNAMYAAGLSINQLSLFALAAVVGMLVDNSIVVVESIFRRARLAHDRREAAWLGSREAARAVLIATASNLAVFVPLFFLDDNMALLIREMALSLIFPIAASLLVAITVTPMLASWGISRGNSNSKSPISDLKSQVPVVQSQVSSLKSQIVQSFWSKWNPYRRPGRPPRNFLREFAFYCAKGAIRHPIRLCSTLVTAFLLTLVVAGIRIAMRGTSGQDKTETVTLYGRAPIGSDLDATDKLFADKERQLREELKGSKVFESFSSKFDAGGGQIEFLVAEKYRHFNWHEFNNAYSYWASGDDRSGFRFYPFAQLSAEAFNPGGGGGGGPMGSERILIQGENLAAMLSAAEMVKARLETSGEATDVSVQTPLGDPEIQFQPDWDLMQALKADGQSLQTLFQSQKGQGVPTDLVLRDGGVDRRVVIKSVSERSKQSEPGTRTMGDLKRLRVALQGGGAAPLEMLGRFSIRQSVPHIEKHNRQRHVDIGFSLKPGFYRPGQEKPRQDALRKIQAGVGAMRLPAGVSAQEAGALEEAKKQASIWKKLLKQGILAVYLVMAFFFDSLILPVIVFCVIPLAAIGAAWMLVLCKGSLDQVAIAGTLLLPALVVGHGIFLVERMRQIEAQGGRRVRALLGAVAQRFRPILMTSLTTGLALAPILFLPGAESAARSMAAVLIGGLTASAFASLIVIPAFYNVNALGMRRAASILGRAACLWAAALERTGLLRRAKPGAMPASPARSPLVVAPNLFAANSHELRISIRNVSKLYPLFHKGMLIGFVPSRTRPVGKRPACGVVALKNVDLEIGQGMFGLLGPNGAGKTTLMQILTGLIPQTYGVVQIAGADLRQCRREIRPYVSYLPQSFGVYGGLDLDQFLAFFAARSGQRDPRQRLRRIDEVIELAGLSGARGKPLRTYSGGMRQRAGIAQMLLSPCPIIIVDEPTAGLDPVERVRFRLLLSQLARERIVILSTHIVDDVTSSCKRVAVLNRGRVVFQGSMDEAREQAQGMVWDLLLPRGQAPGVPERAVLYKKHVADRVLHHYCAARPIPGSTPADPSFEDAYVALLLRHSEDRSAMPEVAR